MLCKIWNIRFIHLIFAIYLSTFHSLFLQQTFLLITYGFYQKKQKNIYILTIYYEYVGDSQQILEYSFGIVLSKEILF